MNIHLNVKDFAETRRALAGLAGGMESGQIPYTPGWYSTSSPHPTIGNGTLNGRYSFTDKRCFVLIELVLGSSTTLGTGNTWRWSLPIDCGSDVDVVGACQVFTNATGTYYTGVSKIVVSSYPSRVFATTHGLVGNIGKNVSPGGWAASDTVLIAIGYPI